MSPAAAFNASPPPSDPQREYLRRSIGLGLLLALLMVATALVARDLGWRIPVYLSFPVFLTANGVLQPAPPGATLRSRRQRIVGATVIAALAGGALWLLERLTV